MIRVYHLPWSVNNSTKTHAREHRIPKTVFVPSRIWLRLSDVAGNKLDFDCWQLQPEGAFLPFGVTWPRPRFREPSSIGSSCRFSASSSSEKSVFRFIRSRDRASIKNRARALINQILKQPKFDIIPGFIPPSSPWIRTHAFYNILWINFCFSENVKNEISKLGQAGENSLY